MAQLSVPTQQLSESMNVLREKSPNIPSPCLPVSNPTRSYWLSENPLAKEGSTGPLASNDIDICIIGSGITGVSCAYQLARLGLGAFEKQIMILEARDFCSGATGRNGGHLTPNPFLEFHDLEKTYSASEAIKTFEFERRTVQTILRFVEESRIAQDIDLVTGGHITLFVTDVEEEIARRDFEAAIKAGLMLNDVEWIDKDDMLERYGTHYPGVRFSAHNLWPLKLVTHMFQVAKDALNLHLHTSTPVLSISRNKGGGRRYTLQTPRGLLHADYIIHATNGYAAYLLPQMHGPTGIIPTRGQVVAVRHSPQRGREREELRKVSWDANEGFEYWFPRPSRTFEEDVPLVILGGGREAAKKTRYELYVSDDSACNEVVGKALRDFLGSLYDGGQEDQRRVEHEWTGIMGYTKTGDPFLGPVVLDPDHPVPMKEYEGQYLAAGYNGHGMPRAFGCAEVIASMLLADMQGKKWIIPDWVPERWLAWKNKDEHIAVCCQ
ncbi:fad dependent oxidoreductase [Moniliophthora roreri MCA 2997]|uniref:Fad dependent oxidoreductase n=2 Tax=Moniliophthora roreri TaxID=221103 RepID=V2YHJ5_MONRO|nr:fad dependent oxidoreductase [Moniliophthora roreri MCA 2997]